MTEEVRQTRKTQARSKGGRRGIRQSKSNPNKQTRCNQLSKTWGKLQKTRGCSFRRVAHCGWPTIMQQLFFYYYLSKFDFQFQGRHCNIAKGKHSKYQASRERRSFLQNVYLLPHLPSTNLNYQVFFIRFAIYNFILPFVHLF